MNTKRTKLSFIFGYLLMLLQTTGLCFLITVSLLSCNNSGPDLNGNWDGNKGYQLTIQKQGDDYNIDWHGWGHKEIYTGRFKDGKISIGQGMLGDISYSESNDKIYFGGEEFKRSSMAGSKEENVQPPVLKDTRDGKEYKTIKIGNQIWMAENLAFKTENGCWAYNNDESNVKTYGYLYNWETAVNISPTGWHVPTDNDWNTLIKFLGGTKLAGGKLRSSQWAGTASSSSDCGFSGLPGGARYSSNFRDIGENGYWWSSTESEYNAQEAWARVVHTQDDVVFGGSQDKILGFSVRCIKD